MNIKKIALILGGFIVIVGLGGLLYMKNTDKPNVDFLINYVKDYRNTKPLSLVVKRNGDEIVSVNSDNTLPLASSVKWTIAVEYAKQVGSGQIDPNEKVNLSTLNQYYIEGTDGGAQPMWIDSLKQQGLLENEETTLREVARGMIIFSSNANTDYLMYRLGIDKINQGIQEMGLKNHQQVYPIAAALCISNYIHNEKGLDYSQIKQELLDMSQEEYNEYALKIHALMNRNELSEEIKSGKRILEDLELQKIWSDRLISASADDYIRLMELINSREYFTEETQKELEAVVEYAMENPETAKRYQHIGLKGGSTMWILTYAMYATDLDGNHTEIVLMFNDLESKDHKKMEENLFEFIKLTVLDESFRLKTVEKLR